MTTLTSSHKRKSDLSIEKAKLLRESRKCPIDHLFACLRIDCIFTAKTIKEVRKHTLSIHRI